MVERLTDRASRVLVLAEEEARLFGHSFIGTEHILCGLVHEGTGIAAQALEALGITLHDVREGIEAEVGQASAQPTGSPSPPFTPRAKKVLELALSEAQALGHGYIGTEHLLLGVVQEGEGVAARIIESLGADSPRVREVVVQLLARQVGPSQDGERLGTSPRCPHCGEPLEKTVRAREFSVGVEDSDRVSHFLASYCSSCGTVMEFSSDD